jgi:hypothetical protein
MKTNLALATTVATAVAAALYFATPTHAQIIEIDRVTSTAMKQLVRAHTQSAGVQALRAEIETRHGVTCKGGSSTTFPALTHRIVYRGECSGANPLTLKIESRYSTRNGALEFTIQSYTVTF